MEIPNLDQPKLIYDKIDGLSGVFFPLVSIKNRFFFHWCLLKIEFFQSFLGATKHLYNWLCPSVGWLVGWLIGLSVTHLFNDLHVAPYSPTWPCL